MNRDRPLFGDAGSYAVGALDVLGPNAAQPCSAPFEAARLRIVAAVFDRGARGVAEEDGVSGLANQTVQPVELLLCTQDEILERFAKLTEFVAREHAGRGAVDGIEAVRVRASLPGDRHVLRPRRRHPSLRYRIHVLDMRYTRVK